MTQDDIPLRGALLDERDAARYLGVSPAYLRAARLSQPRCPGPPYIRLGRAVRYALSDLDQFIAARRVAPDYAEGCQ